jgi:hypothetical protein
MFIPLRALLLRGRRVDEFIFGTVPRLDSRDSSASWDMTLSKNIRVRVLDFLVSSDVQWDRCWESYVGDLHGTSHHV